MEDQKRKTDAVNNPEEQKKKTDPQKDEMEGNVLGDAFKKVFGDTDGKTDTADSPEEKEEKDERGS